MFKTPFKVLFLCKKRVDTYGISFGLLNSASMLAKLMNKNGINAVDMSVQDANGIDKVVHTCQPTHVVIHALWVTPEKMQELCAKHPKVSWNIRIHSKPEFLAMEGIASQWIAGYVKLQKVFPNLWLSANSPETDLLLSNVFRGRSLMLPNVYVKPPKPEQCHPYICDNSRLNIGCFGAIRPLKNHYAQATAAILYGNRHGLKISFHVNGGREEQGGDRVSKNLRMLFANSHGHELVEHLWYSHSNLVHSVLPYMDLVMQVSLSETFNIVAADAVAAGVPVVASKDIYWMSPLFISEPGNLNSMVSKIKLALLFGKFGVWLNWHRLSKSNHEAIKVWKRGLVKTAPVIKPIVRFPVI